MKILATCKAMMNMQFVLCSSTTIKELCGTEYVMHGTIHNKYFYKFGLSVRLFMRTLRITLHLCIRLELTYTMITYNICYEIEYQAFLNLVQDHFKCNRASLSLKRHTLYKVGSQRKWYVILHEQIHQKANVLESSQFTT